MLVSFEGRSGSQICAFSKSCPGQVWQHCYLCLNTPHILLAPSLWDTPVVNYVNTVVAIVLCCFVGSCLEIFSQSYSMYSCAVIFSVFGRVFLFLSGAAGLLGSELVSVL